MGIKKLKKENEILNMSIGDMLVKFDTSKTKKYSQFLVRMLNERIDEWDKNQFGDNRVTNQLTPLDRILPTNTWENTTTRYFVCDWLFSERKMERFIEFTELMEKGLVKENDISKYDSWDMLEMELFEAKNREMFKKSKKEIHKIFEDDDYMIFKPLTYPSSCSYGYQTKWCTAMIDDPGYFYSHSRGILIYLINKKENKKFAFYKKIARPYEITDDHEQYIFKTYNQEDKQIDTIQTGLPMNILQIILMECDEKSPTTVPNYKLFSEEEKEIMRTYHGPLPEDEPVEDVKIMFNSDELPGLNLHPVAVLGRQLRRRGTFIPLSAFEPHGEDFEAGMEEINDECIMKEEYATQEKILEMRVDIAREELEQQIMEHLMKESNDR